VRRPGTSCCRPSNLPHCSIRCGRTPMWSAVDERSHVRKLRIVLFKCFFDKVRYAETNTSQNTATENQGDPVFICLSMTHTKPTCSSLSHLRVPLRPKQYKCKNRHCLSDLCAIVSPALHTVVSCWPRPRRRLGPHRLHPVHNITSTHLPSHSPRRRLGQ
jgi:hypothetical protein